MAFRFVRLLGSSRSPYTFLTLNLGQCAQRNFPPEEIQQWPPLPYDRFNKRLTLTYNLSA